MLMHPDRGMRLPRRVSYLALLLAALLGLGLVPIGQSTLPAAWGQEAPETTSPDSTDTTAAATTESTSTPTSTAGPCAATTTETGATEPCAPPTTAGEPLVGARGDLEAVAPQVLVDAAAAAGTTTENATSILSTTDAAPTDVEVAKQPGGDVEVTGAGAAIDVGLPTPQEATPARVGNLAVFAPPDPDRAAVAVQPRDTGAKVLVIIRSAADPQTYRFPVKVPAGGRLVPMAGGKSGLENTPEERNTTGFVILDRDGQGVGSIGAPWALDSTGQPVLTWYTREPGAIIQSVAHIGAHYPVVADPLLSIGCAWTTCAVWFSTSVTRTLARFTLAGRIGFALAAEGLCLGLANPVAILVCSQLVGAFGDELIGKLQDARNQGACLRVSFTPLVSLSNFSPIHFAADGSRACDRGAESGHRVAGIRPGSQAFVINRRVTFTAVGGALFWIPNTEQLGLLTGDQDNPWGSVRQISTRQIRRYRDLPADGTLFQEVSSSQAYYVSAGHCWSVTADQFVRHGFEASNIKKIPDGGLRQCPLAGALPD
jgi:cytoskeletal protein RodZ